MSLTPESNASTDLIWLLTRKNHSKMEKRPHGGIRTLSTEYGNVMNLHSFKYGGYAQRKSVSIRPQGNSVLLVTKRSKKSGPHTVGQSADKRVIRPGSGPRRTTKIVESAIAKYRPSLAKPAAARASAIVKSQRKAKEPRQRQPRGKKAIAAAAAAAEGEE